MPSEAIGVLEQLAQRSQEATAKAAARYREIVLSGGPTDSQASELQSLMLALSLSTADVQADIAAAAKLHSAEQQHAQDYGDANAQAARQSRQIVAIEALNDFIDATKRHERERDLRNAVSDAELELKRAANAEAELREARQAMSDRLMVRDSDAEPQKSPDGRTIIRQTIVIDEAAHRAEQERELQEQQRLAELQEERSRPRAISAA